jgi:MFS family permease
MGSLNVMPTYLGYFTLTTATKSLNTAISYVGGACAAIPAGFVTDWRGRRETIYWSCAITLIGAGIQSAAQNIGMFIAGRFILGFGMAFATTAAPTYVSETVPQKWRGLALGLYYSCWCEL